MYPKAHLHLVEKPPRALASAVDDDVGDAVVSYDTLCHERYRVLCKGALKIFRGQNSFGGGSRWGGSALLALAARWTRLQGLERMKGWETPGRLGGAQGEFEASQAEF
jgi:hypothetical protein